MSTRTTGRAVGACFLLAFVFYIAGGTMVDSGSGTPAILSRVVDHQSLIEAGALLMMVNSVATAAIGVLMFPILKRRHEVSAYGYLICLSIAAVLLVVGTVFLLLLVPIAKEFAGSGGKALDLPVLARVAQEANRYSYEVGMIALSFGGLVLCRVLFRARLVPRFLAVWGLVGYALLLNGSVLEVLGYGAGIALSVPGGVFEVVLGGLLIGRGFTVVDGHAPDSFPPEALSAGRPAGELRSESSVLTAVRNMSFDTKYWEPAAGTPTEGPTLLSETSSDDRSFRAAAIAAGVGILVVAALAVFGDIVAIEGLITPGNAAQTARDISQSETLFRLGIVSLILAAVVDVVVAWGLYWVFRAVNMGQSLLGAWFRLAYAATFVVAVSQLLGALRLLDGSKDAAFNTAQVHSQAMSEIHAFSDVWNVSLVLFGAHLLVVGYLAHKSGFVPKYLGFLICLAGGGYLFDGLAAVLSNGAAPKIARFTFVGEFGLALWLLIRGRCVAEVGGGARSRRIIADGAVMAADADTGVRLDRQAD